MRRYAGRGNWMQVANRPVRPMTTVVLDAKQKLQLLADINEYLHPATARWYANRGIPLRRGYLFHGPPGTGKTSLSFALAGVFGLDIYVISLLEPTLTEEDVGVLFNSLPRRCVVLLEDIDTAGLTRADANAGKEAGKDGGAPINEWKVTDLAKALKDNKPNSENNGISLSGLLNAIDGVASHEGRVLIMTTNKPETLDEALLRPGRVDLQVAFTNATKTQAKELFERMYEADQKPLWRRRDQMHQAGHAKVEKVVEKEKVANGHANGHTENAINGLSETKKSREDTEPHTTADIQDDERLEITREELSEIAAEFAQKIPDGAFSPAEIQGFLLKRKKLPRKALAEVGHWVEGMLESKASKAKVLQVQ
jgi:mitochondrial chaperone BCS1